jgi:hypothetical protein
MNKIKRLFGRPNKLQKASIIAFAVELHATGAIVEPKPSADLYDTFVEWHCGFTELSRVDLLVSRRQFMSLLTRYATVVTMHADNTSIFEVKLNSKTMKDLRHRHAYAPTFTGDEEFADEGVDEPGELLDDEVDDEIEDSLRASGVEDDPAWARERADNLASDDANFFDKYIKKEVDKMRTPITQFNTDTVSSPASAAGKHTAVALYFDRVLTEIEQKALYNLITEGVKTVEERDAVTSIRKDNVITAVTFNLGPTDYIDSIDATADVTHIDGDPK